MLTAIYLKRKKVYSGKILSCKSSNLRFCTIIIITLPQGPTGESVNLPFPAWAGMYASIYLFFKPFF